VARFGYQLLWVLVLSNAMAVLLQTLSARLGIVAGRDLAQACREAYPKPVSYALWVLCEAAIAACDLAEVLGAAIGLNLLFGIPLIAGVLITAADTLFILWFSRFGIRLVEALIIGLIGTIGICFLVEIILARPDFGGDGDGLDSAHQRREFVCGDRDSRRDGDAAQSVSSRRARAKPVGSENRRRRSARPVSSTSSIQ
jgi:manganese transport protein